MPPAHAWNTAPSATTSSIPKKTTNNAGVNILPSSADDDDIVVVVQGGDRDTMRQALDAVADEVKHRPERFDRLFYHVDLRHLHDRALLFLPTEQIAHIDADVRNMRMLLEPPLVSP